MQFSDELFLSCEVLTGTLAHEIAGVVASLTEGELRGESEQLQSHAWLTGTALRGGQGVGMFRLM